MRIAINGLGRMGRGVLRVLYEQGRKRPNARFFGGKTLEVVAANDIGSPDDISYLLRHDTVHGRFCGSVEAKDGALIVEGHEIQLFSEKEPGRLPWRKLGVDLVIEATGKFTDREKAAPHLDAGASRVLVTAPAKGADCTFVLGVNEGDYDGERHRICSIGSCTTNALAVVAKVLDDAFDVQQGLACTTHAYTSSQSLVDSPTKKRRRGRAAAANIVPTTTGAAQSTTLAIPKLQGRMNGLALRVPVTDVSIVDFTCLLEERPDAVRINDEFRRRAEKGDMEGILAVDDEELVSSDHIGSPFSAVVDAASTLALPGGMVKVMAWYDNEIGYCYRVVESAGFMLRS